MQYIKYLGKRLNKAGNSFYSWGVFRCSFCREMVERRCSTGIKTKSCGCNPAYESHMESYHLLYGVWNSMKQRCSNPKTKQYNDYGGRGIKVCKEWVKSYITFRDWAVLNGYAKGLCIDRTDNDAGYNPGNCRWATYSVNLQNSRPK